MRLVLVVVAGLTCLFGCGTPAGSPDGSSWDGGAPPDAGSAIDAAGLPDAQVQVPADAGSAADSGRAADAGLAAPDAGPAAPDAGQASVDAGSFDPAAVEASFQVAICEARVRCELNQDQATCLQSFADKSGTSFGSLAALVDAAAAGQVAVVPGEIPGCLAAMRALGCSDSATGGDVPGIPACRAAFPHGSVAAGSACIHSAACVSGTYCRLAAAGTCSGVCTGEQAECTGPLGDPTDAVCGFARGCAKSGTTYQCTDFRAAGAEGQPCGSRSLCGVGLECSAGLCQPLPSAGAACSILVGCHDPAVETCVFQGSPGAFCMAGAAAGGSCQYATQCGGFESPLACDPALLVCVERPAAGEPCVLAAPGNAIGFCDELTAWCDTSLAPPTCTAYKASGAACGSNDECGPFWSNRKCVAAKCKTLPAAQRCAP